jgi:endonuclease III
MDPTPGASFDSNSKILCRPILAIKSLVPEDGVVTAKAKELAKILLELDARTRGIVTKNSRHKWPKIAGCNQKIKYVVLQHKNQNICI